MDPKKVVTVAGVGAVSAGVAYLGAPVVLSVMGFKAAGVAAGSIAAAVQTPAIASGSVFALCQSAGVLGLAGTTKAVICGAAGAAGAGITTAVKALPKQNPL